MTGPGVVVDASVLIALAKIGRADVLRAVYGYALLGPVVKEEVLDRGKAVGARGVEHVEAAIAAGWLRVVRPVRAERERTRSLVGTTRLDPGEAEAIALAWRRKLLLVVDDKEARHTADALGLTYLGTVGVLLEAYRGGHFSLPAFEDMITDLTKILWLSPGVVATVLRRAREERR